MGGIASVLGLGLSESDAQSQQINKVDTVLSFGGQCNFTAGNYAYDTSATIGGRVEGDVNVVRQTAVVDANCMITNNINSVVDIFNKARNSSTADSPSSGALFDAAIARVNESTAESDQSNFATLRAAVTETCGLTTANTAGNTVILVSEGGVIGGDLNVVSQTANTSGSCTLSNGIDASTSFINDAANASSSAGARMSWLMIAIIGGVIVLVVGLIAFLTRGSPPAYSSPHPGYPPYSPYPPYPFYG